MNSILIALIMLIISGRRPAFSNFITHNYDSFHFPIFLQGECEVGVEGVYVIVDLPKRV